MVKIVAASPRIDFPLKLHISLCYGRRLLSDDDRSEFAGEFVPEDHLEWIDAGDYILTKLQHANNLCGFKGDIGVDEEKMRRALGVQKFRHERVAASRDKRVVTQQFDGDTKAERGSGLQSSITDRM